MIWGKKRYAVSENVNECVKDKHVHRESSLLKKLTQKQLRKFQIKVHINKHICIFFICLYVCFINVKNNYFYHKRYVWRTDRLQKQACWKCKFKSNLMGFYLRYLSMSIYMGVCRNQVWGIPGIVLERGGGDFFFPTKKSNFLCPPMSYKTFGK